MFDWLFGSDTTETTSNTDSKVRFPPQFRDLATAVGQMGSSLAGTNPNNMIAGFSPDQLASFQALRDLATTDPTGYFNIMNQVQQQALGAGTNDTTTAGTGALEDAISGSQNNPNVNNAIGALLNPTTAQQVDPNDYRSGVPVDQVGTDQWSSGALDQYMSPYQQGVIDNYLTEYNRQADIDRAKSARERAARGAFGSRADLAETEEDRNIADVRQKGLASLLQSGYDKASDLFTSDQSRALQAGTANQGANLQSGLAGLQAGLSAAQGNQGAALDAAKVSQSGALGGGQLAQGQNKLTGDLAAQLAALGIDTSKLNLSGLQTAADAAGAERTTAVGNAGLLSGVGDTYQQQQQKVLDAPWTQLDRLTGTLAGVPTGTSSTTVGTAPSGNGSPLSQLAGAGIAAYGLFGGGTTGAADGGLVEGGGDKPMQRIQVGPGDWHTVTSRMADGGQVGVKAKEPGIGDRNPRYATSYLDDIIEAQDAGFDIDMADPEMDDVAASIGANPFYYMGALPADYSYAGQLPDRGPMPMMPENDRTWQFLDDPLSSGGHGALAALGKGVSQESQNPFMTASWSELADAFDAIDSLSDQQKRWLMQAVHLRMDESPGEGYATGGTIDVNPFLGQDPEELIALLQSNTLSPEERAQVRDAIEGTMTVEPADYARSADDTSALEMLRDMNRSQATDAAMTAGVRDTMGENGDEFRDLGAISDYDARRYGSGAAAGQMLTPTFASPLDRPISVGGPMDRPRAPIPLMPTSEVPMAGTVPLTGRYQAVKSGLGEPRSIETPRRLGTSVPLVDAATHGALPMPDMVGGSSGMGDTRGLYPRGLASTGGPARYLAGTTDFTQPGSMVGAVSDFLFPAWSAAPPPSSPSGGVSEAPAASALSSSGALSAAGAPNSPWANPPIPQRPPEMGGADEGDRPSDWFDRALNNPLVQLGLAMMTSKQPGLFGALGEAGQAVLASRQAAEDQAWERSLKERGMAIDEAMLALNQRKLEAALAGGGGRGGGSGGGGGGGSGGGGTAATDAAQMTALDARSMEYFGVPFSKIGNSTIEQALAYEVLGDGYKGAFNAAIRPDRASQGASTADVASVFRALQQEDGGMTDVRTLWAQAADIANGGEGGGMGGFGNLGALTFVPMQPAPPAGFVRE